MKNSILILLVLIGVSQTNAQYVWTQKAAFGGGDRYGTFSFSINGKGYAGSGVTFTGTSQNYVPVDFWEYNPVADSWTQKSDIPGSCKDEAIGFSIGSKGYFTTGWNPAQSDETYEYDPAVNVWTVKTNFAGGPRYTASSFTIGNFAYVGTGYAPYYSDFWKYDPATDSWTQIANIGGQPRSAATGFSIGNDGYVFGGGNQFSFYSNEMWKYDPSSNTWNQVASLPAPGRVSCPAFSFSGKGFVGCGTDEFFTYEDFYEYDPVADAWTQIADFGGGTRLATTFFAIGDKGYAGSGTSDFYPNINLINDFWELQYVYEHNIIQGSLYIDANNNSNYDAGELVIKNRIIETTPGPVYVSSNSTGSYMTPVDTGTFTVTIPNPPAYYSYAPASISKFFASASAIDSNNNFAFYPLANINDLRIVVAPNGNQRHGDPDDYITVTYKNIGTTVMSGTIDVLLDTNMTYVMTTPADTTMIQNGYTLTYSYSGLLQGETRVFQIKAYVPNLMGIVDTLLVSGTIYPVIGDTVPADNYYLAKQPILSSCDPNDIVVDRSEITPAQVSNGQWLEYTIHFQNTGNADAINITVQDTLGAMLDIPSIDFLASSHTCNFLMEGAGIAKFVFPNIHLIDSNTNEALSHGFIKYRIKVKSSLTIGDVIENTAGIYFDFNPVVVTNTAHTTVANPLSINATSPSAFTVSPNPVKDKIYILCDKTEGYNISIFSIRGKNILKQHAEGGKIEIPFRNFSSGIYILQLECNGEFTRTKFLKE